MTPVHPVAARWRSSLRALSRLVLVAMAGCGGEAAPRAGNSDAAMAAPTDAGTDAPKVSGAERYEPRDGTRVKVTWTTTTDGVRAPLGLYDTTLGEGCQLVAGPDGAYRCAPGGFGTLVYTDAGCRDAILSWQVSSCDTRFARTQTYEGCRLTSTAVWRVGDPLPLTKVFAHDAAGECSPSSVAPGYEVRAITAVPDAMIVSGRRVELDDGRIRRQIVELEDGARSRPIGWRDTTLGFTCSVGIASDGVSRCLPENAYGGPSFITSSTTGPYTDPACKEHLTYEGICSDRTVKPFLNRTDRSTCPARREIHPRGVKIDQLYFVDSPGVCQLRATGSALVYTVEPEVPPSTYAPLEPGWTALPGTGRLRAMAYGANALTELGASFHDVQLDARCSAQRTSDGTLRCLPDEIEYSSNSRDLFADQGCTIPMIASYPDRCKPPRLWLSTERSGCSSVYRAFTFGPIHEGRYFSKDRDGTCSPREQDPKSAYGYARVGPEIAPSEFAALTQ